MDFVFFSFGDNHAAELFFTASTRGARHIIPPVDSSLDARCPRPFRNVLPSGSLYATQFYLEALMGMALRKEKERER